MEGAPLFVLILSAVIVGWIVLTVLGNERQRQVDEVEARRLAAQVQAAQSQAAQAAASAELAKRAASLRVPNPAPNSTTSAK